MFWCFMPVPASLADAHETIRFHFAPTKSAHVVTIAHVSVKITPLSVARMIATVVNPAETTVTAVALLAVLTAPELSIENCPLFHLAPILSHLTGFFLLFGTCIIRAAL